MKAKEIKDMQSGELTKKLGEKQKELFDLRAKAVTKHLKNHRQIPQVKKDIARMKTIKRQQELGIEKA